MFEGIPGAEGEVGGEEEFYCRKKRANRAVAYGRLGGRGTSGVSAFWRAREFAALAEERLKDTDRVVDRHSCGQGQQHWEQQEIPFPSCRVEMPLRDDVKDRYRYGGDQENWQIDKQAVERAVFWAEGMWQRQHAHEDKQEVAEVRGEVGCGFQFDDQRDGGVPDFREDFQTGLDGALGPALLLGLEAVHFLG